MKFFLDECLEFATISSLLLFWVGGECLPLLLDLDLFLLSLDLDFLFFFDRDLFLFESFFLLLLLLLRFLLLSFSRLRLLLRLSFSLLLLLLLLLLKPLLLLLLLARLLLRALSIKSSEESDAIEELLFFLPFFFLFEAFPFLSRPELLPSDWISITCSSDEEERTSMG